MDKMRCAIISWMLILLSESFYGQNVNELFFDEAVVSFNRTNLADNNTEDRNGFGLGVYHSFLPKSIVNLTFGLEYNRTNQFKKYMYGGYYVHYSDVSYNMNMLSFPVGIRINMGSKLKFFFEAGAYADMMIKSTRTGVKHTFNPDVSDSTADLETTIDEKAGLSNVLGVYSGLGVRIPFSAFELVIKGDYKYGLKEIYSYVDIINNYYWRISVGIKHK